MTKPLPQPTSLNKQPGQRVATARQLERYQNAEFTAGRSVVTQCLWYAVSLIFFESGLLPLSAPKRWLLRRFGATIGQRVVIKPHVRIKYPWRLNVGNYSWIGEEVWIDNLAEVAIGQSVCLSQRAYLCTGSHDDSSETFELITAPITIHDGAWIATGVTVLGGVVVGTMTTVCAGAVVTKNLPAHCRCAGTPAKPLPTPAE